MTEAQRVIAYKDWQEVYNQEVFDRVRHWGNLSLRLWPVPLRWPDLDPDGFGRAL